MYQFRAFCKLTAIAFFAAAPSSWLSRATAAPADDQYAVAAGHYSSRRWLEAAEEFRLYLQEFGSHERADSARFFHAEALLQLGRHLEASAAFAEFLKRHPDHRYSRQALFRAGEAAYLAGANEEALRNLEAFRQKHRDDELLGYAGRYLGELYLDAGKAAEALQAFDEGLARLVEGPLADECRFGAARACETLKDYIGAERRYRALVAAKTGELADDAQLQLGLLAFQREQYGEAIETLRAFESEFSQSDLSPYARYWLGRGQLARAAWQEAAQTLLQLADEHPKHELAPAAVFSAGEAHRKGGQAPLAVEQFDRLLSQWPQSAWADDALQAKIQTVLEERLALPLERLAAEFERRFPTSDLRGPVRLALGRWQLQQANYTAAVAALEEFLTLHTDGADSAKARAQLASALSGAKRFADAAQVLDELQTLHPNEPLLMPTTLHVAEGASAAEQHELARRLFERAARNGNPPEIVARGLAGLARLKADTSGGNAAGAIDRLLKEYPESAQAPEAALLKARDLERAGEREQAQAAYVWLLEKYPASPEAPLALLSAARLLEEAKQNEAAATLLEKFLREYGESKLLDAALYQYAWVLVDLSREREADAQFSRIHRAHRTSRYWADATYRLSERAAEAKDFARAAKLAEELLRSPCEDEIKAHALYLQGQLAALEKRWSDVPDSLSRLIEEFPQSELVLAAEYWVAEAHFRQGELERAEGEFRRLAAKAEGRDEPWLAMIPLRQAQIHGHRKEWNAAHDVAQTISERFPNFRQQYEVDYLLGRCLGSRGEFTEARAAYERVVRSPEGGRTETAAMAQWMIGESYFHQKQYDEAIRAYHRVEHLFAFSRWQAAALLQAGKCREAQGDWLQASRLYAQLLKEFPETTFTEEAAKRLRAAQEQAAARTSAKK